MCRGGDEELDFCLARCCCSSLLLMRLATVESQDSPERNRDPTQRSTTTDATPIRGWVRLADCASGSGTKGTPVAPVANGEDDSVYS